MNYQEQVYRDLQEYLKEPCKLSASAQLGICGFHNWIKEKYGVDGVSSDSSNGLAREDGSGEASVKNAVGLLPCPFCDGEAAIAKHTRHEFYIHCTNCELIMLAAINVFFTSEKNAIDGWNTRRGRPF